MASITCGNCHNTHTSTQEVRNCYAGLSTQWPPQATQYADDTNRAAFNSVARGSARFGRASDAQRRYITRLLEERDTTGTFYAKVSDNWLMSIGSNEASKAIDTLKALPKKSVEQREHERRDVELEDAIYLRVFTDGPHIFKVYHTVHGANQQVAKELVVADGKATFEYRGKAPLQHLLPEHRMTREQALEYSALYGVCVRCGATLTREESIERAMGPVCYAKMGG